MAALFRTGSGCVVENIPPGGNIVWKDVSKYSPFGISGPVRGNERKHIVTMTHSVRNSVRAKHTTYSLGESGLDLEQDGVVMTVPYGDIKRVNLIAYAATNGRQGQLSLLTRTGEKLVVRSHHFQGLGQFENRSETYGQLVRGLLQRISIANPVAVFVTGSNLYWYLWAMVLALSVIVAAILVYALVAATPPIFPMIMSISFIVFCGFIAWHSLGTSRQTPFDPDAPPANFLSF